MSSLTILVAIAIPIAVSVVLFFIGCCFLRRRVSKKFNILPEENDYLITFLFSFLASVV